MPTNHYFCNMPDNSNFDPNSPGLRANNIFGLPFTETTSQVILLPVPWEVTVSYRKGTARGPEHIFNASLQVDLYDHELLYEWKKGYYMLPVDSGILMKSDQLREYTEEIIDSLEEGKHIADDTELTNKLDQINDGCKMLLDRVYEITKGYLKQGKKIGLIGGDHSTPLGYIKALGEVYDDIGILQIDAHADLRIAYEGFIYSHASIMYNVLAQVPAVSRLLQVGVRDLCDEEAKMIQDSDGRIITFFDKNIKEHRYKGVTWHDICQNITDLLPQHVYVSFDIDGLDPKLCPHTGTPVPGGFEMAEVFYLFKLIHESGRQIIGFDLNEVSNGDIAGDSIDAIVGSRVLYKLCNYLATSEVSAI